MPHWLWPDAVIVDPPDEAAETACLAKLKVHTSPTLDDLLETLDRADVKAMMAAFGRYTIRATVADMPRFKARSEAAKRAARQRA
jgi:hypothetical protein